MLLSACPSPRVQGKAFPEALQIHKVTSSQPAPDINPISVNWKGNIIFSHQKRICSALEQNGVSLITFVQLNRQEQQPILQTDEVNHQARSYNKEYWKPYSSHGKQN
jgi:hypothetical protein